MKKCDVLVIGSSAAGLVAANTAKTTYPEKSVTVVRLKGRTLVPCGIPYVFSTIETTENNIIPVESGYEKMGITLLEDRVESIDRIEKTCALESGETVRYEKLVLATGSVPVIPSWLKGKDLENVFSVPKNKEYLDAMQKALKGCRSVVTIGAGFIGVELSDELNKAGKKVTLVEKMTHILGKAFDAETASRAENLLKEAGVEVITGTGVKEIIGKGKVEAVLLENGEKIPADAVILAMGYRPNSDLAKEAGLMINELGAIKVDEYMRTDDEHIFAVGDCAEKKDFVTRKTSGVMLASTACAEARIAGMNLYKLSLVKTFSGTISIFATALGDEAFGVAGLTESRALEEGFDIITGEFEGPDKHPGKLPGTKKQKVKLIVGKEAGIILGGEITGGLSVGELTNALGFIIQNRMDINAILVSQIGTHPLLTASPAAYPLLKAAEDAAKKKMGLCSC
ncbi:FAD-dependent oxidoreductase [Candidatus Mcinerneyibacteriota bacterium]|nr:FAD-dependent oxidoreductase [Candidatus Mcinerneyibacteriota bacterium]